MKIKDIERLYNLYTQRKSNTYVARLWDGYTRIAEGADIMACHDLARAAIRKAESCLFVGTLYTQVKAVNNDVSGNPRVDYIAYLNLTKSSLSPLSNAPDGVFNTQKEKADRGYAGTDQPVEDAAEWVRQLVEEHCRASVYSGELVFLVDPTRHTPSEMDARATPPSPVQGSYVSQSYLVYVVPTSAVSALHKSNSTLQPAVLPRLTAHYFHLYRRAVAYNKAVQVLDELLLINPVVEHNTSDFIQLRDTYRTSLTINLDKS